MGVDVSGECLAVASVFLEEDSILGNAIESADFANGVNWWSFGVVPGNRHGGFVHVLLSEGRCAGERLTLRNGSVCPSVCKFVERRFSIIVSFHPFKEDLELVAGEHPDKLVKKCKKNWFSKEESAVDGFDAVHGVADDGDGVEVWKV